MGLMRQSDFSYGVVDPDLHAATDAPQYLQSLSEGKNILISSKRLPTKRLGIELAYTTSATIAETKVKSMPFETKEGVWHQCILHKDNNQLWAMLLRYEANGNISEINLNIGSYAGDIDDVSMASTNDYIVLTNFNFHPKKITIENILTSSKVEDINFSVMPSLPSDEIDYSGYTFKPSGNPMGSTMTVTIPGGGTAFNSDWIGGLFIDEFGLSSDNPVAYGLIASVSPLVGTTQTLGLTVLTAFANRPAPGDVVSVRKPVWSNEGGWPSLCLFYQSRLWLVGTRDKPFFVAGSHENQPNNFNVGTGQPSDAIAQIMSNTSGGGIKKIFGGHNLHIWTDQSQIIVPSGMDVGITTGSFSTPQVSSYRISSMDPVQYKNNIYFTTSTGKGVIEVSETQGESASADLSFSAEHLIKNPIKAQMTIEEDTQEQYLYLLNNDNTITAFSKSDISGVNAFTWIRPTMLGNSKYVSIDTINNSLYGTVKLSDGKLAIVKFSAPAYLDFYTYCTFANNQASVSTIYNTNTLSIVKDEGNGQFSYLGDQVVTNGEIAPAFTVADGNYLVGKIYETQITSMPLFLNKFGSFYKKKIFQIYIEYYQSYNFTVNGKVTAVSSFADSTKPKTPKTGVVRLGYGQGYQNDNYIDIKQHSPHPLTIQSIGWITTGSAVA